MNPHNKESNSRADVNSPFTLVSGLNYDGCKKYRSGDFAGSLSCFVEGLRCHEQSSNCHRGRAEASGDNSTNGYIYGTREAEWNASADSNSNHATNCMDQALHFDEGMHAFANVLQFGMSLNDQRTNNHSIVLAILRFNAGQAHHRASAFDKAFNQYTAAHCALDSKRNEEKITPLTTPPSPSGFTAVAFASSLSLSTHPIIIPILHNIGQLQYRN
eukprot:8417360-Ditylum_brightwellii.AAC.1